MKRIQFNPLVGVMAALLAVALLTGPALADRPLADGDPVSPRIGLGFSWGSGSDDEWDEEWDESWDNREHERSTATRRSRHRQPVEFEYRDRDYLQVYLAGDFTGWELEPMELDRWGESWIISWDVSPGSHSYQFTVEDDQGSWTAIDPDNPDAHKHEEFGWVSELERRFRREERGRDRRAKRWDDDIDWVNRDRVGREFEMYSSGHRVDEGDVAVSYQRVDGLSVSIRPEHWGAEDFEPSAHGMVGYGFKSKEWQFGLTVLQPLLPRNFLWLRLNGFIGTDHTDNTGIGGLENSLAAVFFREDFRDYYWREGVSFSLVFGAYHWLRAEGGINSSDYSSVTNHSNWSFADGRFDPNPAIDEGTLRSCYANLRLGTELNHVEATFETCGDNILGGSYGYDRLTTQLRGRIPISRWQNIDFRIKGGGNLSGHLPAQKRYLLGGLGTVRGYGYQSLVMLDANRDPLAPIYGGELMALGNVEYSLGSLVDFPGLVLFYDIGMAWEDREAAIDLDDMKQSAGIGFQLDDEGLRVDVIRPLDSDDDDLVVQLRLNHSF